MSVVADELKPCPYLVGGNPKELIGCRDCFVPRRDFNGVNEVIAAWNAKFADVEIMQCCTEGMRIVGVDYADEGGDIS